MNVIVLAGAGAASGSRKKDDTGSSRSCDGHRSLILQGRGWFGATCYKTCAHIKTVLAAARWWVRKGAWSLGVRLDAEGLTSRQRSSGDGTVMAPGTRGDVWDEVNAQGGGGPTGARLGVG